ncbi:MAG: cytochrome c maturation protein CcmE [SAR86 cluster bacterium]|nr:cytochrome c maturation protein CcmE [SAR86 cluster bacterium]
MHPIRKQRLYVVLSILLGTALASFLVFKGLSENINLFYSPSDLKEKNISVDDLIRVGGMVKKDSINKENNSLRVSFVVTDFEEDLVITYQGILPDLFSEEAGIVAKGKLNNEGIFIASEVLAKHDENYMPPEVAKALKDKK